MNRHKEAQKSTKRENRHKKTKTQRRKDAETQRSWANYPGIGPGNRGLRPLSAARETISKSNLLSPASLLPRHAERAAVPSSKDLLDSERAVAWVFLDTLGFLPTGTPSIGSANAGTRAPAWRAAVPAGTDPRSEWRGQSKAHSRKVGKGRGKLAYRAKNRPNGAPEGWGHRASPEWRSRQSRGVREATGVGYKRTPDTAQKCPFASLRLCVFALISSPFPLHRAATGKILR